MEHISVASSFSFLFTIIHYIIVFICMVLISFGVGSYSNYQLSNSIYENDSPKEYGYFASFYKNKLVVEKKGIISKVNEGEQYTISTCSYQEIQSSVNKSCGNLTGIYNTELLVEIFNKIDHLSGIVSIIIIGLILISLIIAVSVYKLILPSASKSINQQELQFKYKKRRFLFKYFRISFIFTIIPNSILLTYYNELENFFSNINGISYSDTSDSFSFCIIAICFNCLAIAFIIICTCIYLTRKNTKLSSMNISYSTPGGEYTPLKNNENQNNLITPGFV